MPTKTDSRTPIAGLALLVAGFGCAPQVSATTLTEALRSTWQSNPQLRAEQARLRATGEKLNQAEAGWRPEVALKGSVGSQHIDTSLSPEMGGADLTKTLNPRAVSLEVAQPIYSGGGTVAATRQARNAILAEQAKQHQVEQGVFLETITAYLDVLRDQSVLELERNNVKVLQEQLDATQARQEVGELTPTDVYQAQARLAQAKARQRRAAATLAASNAAYQRSVGSRPDTLTPPPGAGAMPASLDAALKQALANNPGLIEGRYALASANNGIDVVRAAGRPSVTLTGAVMHSDQESIFSKRTDSSQVMLNVSVPLYQGGSTSSRTREAEQTAAQRQADLDNIRQQITESVTAAWESWQAAQSEVSAFHEQTRAAGAALHGVRAEAEVGTRTTLDVLNAQQEFLNAQVNVTTAEHDEMLAAYRLKAAMGQLTADSLGIGNVAAVAKR